MPAQFWSLTMPEFGIKWRAFHRAEKRRDSALIRQALRTTNFSDQRRRELNREAKALKQYPIKKWRDAQTS